MTARSDSIASQLLAYATAWFARSTVVSSTPSALRQAREESRGLRGGSARARGEVNVRVTASRRRGTPRAGRRRGSSSAQRRAAEDARAVRGAGRRRPPPRARARALRVARDVQLVPGRGVERPAPVGPDLRPDPATRAAGRRRAERPLRFRGRGEAPSPPLRAGAGFQRSGRAPRARPAGRTHARARSSRARRERPRT